MAATNTASLTIVGGVTVDVILPNTPRLPSWPRHGEFTPENLVLLREPPLIRLGGNGGNAALVAARCGARVSLHTRLGDDVHGQLARAWLEKENCRVCTPSGVATPFNVTAANRRGERATFFYADAPPSFSVEGIAAASYLLVCGWPHPPLASMASGFAQAQARRIVTAMDPGPILAKPWTRKALQQVLNHLDLFIANEYELKTLMGAKTLDRALALLRDKFSGHIVIKRGARGAIWLPPCGSKAENIPPVRVKAVSTVGAGDTFNGGLMAALACGDDFRVALRSAAEIAASAVGSPAGVLGVKRRIR